MGVACGARGTALAGGGERGVFGGSSTCSRCTSRSSRRTAHDVIPPEIIVVESVSVHTVYGGERGGAGGNGGGGLRGAWINLETMLLKLQDQPGCTALP